MLEHLEAYHSYDEYLDQHRMDVIKAFNWLKNNLSYMFPESIQTDSNPLKQLVYRHDLSKYSSCEYEAYKNYFYGTQRTKEIEDAFDKAWLHHIWCNPHHWQHWVLVDENPLELKPLPMPDIYVIEMICDWWSFSWKTNDLMEVFNWYEDHKGGILLEHNTQEFVENFLSEMKKKLLELEETA